MNFRQNPIEDSDSRVSLSKARFSRSKLKDYGVERIKKMAESLGVGGELDIENDKSVVDFVSSVQAKILESSNVPESYKNKHRKYLKDTLFGPITLRGLEMASKKEARDDLGQEVSAPLRVTPERTEKREYGGEMSKFNFQPDIIVAFGCNEGSVNTKRALTAMKLLNAKNPQAILIATGTSKRFRDQHGSSEAEGMYTTWEEAGKETGYSKEKLREMLEAGQIVLEKKATNSRLNIINTFANIAKRAYESGGETIKICLVSNTRGHCDRLVKYLREEWEKYIRKGNTPFNLEVACFYGKGGFVLSPWVWEGDSTQRYAAKKTPPAVTAEHGDYTVSRQPLKSSEDHIFNEWELKFSSGQRIYCGGSLGRRGNGFDPELAKMQLKKKGVKYVFSFVNHGPIKAVVDELNEEGYGITLVTRMHLNEARESHFERNKPLWERLGQLISSGENLIVHCMNGAHRGPSALTAGLIASGKVSSLGEAIKMSGLKLVNFKPSSRSPGFPGLIWQLIKFAKEKNLRVEDEYLRFYAQYRKGSDPRLA